MVDIDNVSKKILDDAALEREKNLNDGREKASAVMKETEIKKKKLLDEGKQKAEERYKETYNREILKAKSDFKQKILLYKLSIIDEIIKKAKGKLSDLSKENYEKFIKKSLKDLSIKEGLYLIGNKEKYIDDKTLQSLSKEIKIKLEKSNIKNEFERGLKIFSGNAQYNISPEAVIESEVDDIKMEIALFLFGKGE